MIAINIFLTVLSPYTAFIPMIFITFKVLENGCIIYNNPWNAGLLSLFIWSLLVGLINKSPFSSAASLVILIYLFVSIYFQNYYNEERKIEKLFKSIILFSIGSAFIGILEKITSLFSDYIHWGYLFGMPSQLIVREAYRISATFGNPNVAGSWYATIILLCIYFYDKTSNSKRIFYGITVCLFIIVLQLTGSRGAAVGLLFGLITYGFLKEDKNNKIFLIFVFASIVVLMFIPPQLLTKIFPETQSINTSMNHALDSSVSGRWTIWIDSLNMFKMKPITGWGLMGIYFADGNIWNYHVRQPHAHNIWITIAATLGFVGLSIYIYMTQYIFKCTRLLFINRSNLLPLLASIQAIVIGHGLVDFTTMTPQGGIIYIGCSAMIASLAMQHSRASDAISMPLSFNSKRLQN